MVRSSSRILNWPACMTGNRTVSWVGSTDVRREAWNWVSASWTLEWIFQGWMDGSGHCIMGASMPGEEKTL